MNLTPEQLSNLEKIAGEIDLAKAEFDIQLIEEDLARGLLCEASVTILKGGLDTIKKLVEFKKNV
ncbi:MAG: hypothetical protein KC589_07885 [Nanoarchaeota archaeon]|nr:hypothetical protein [Nanoarchaeota archaeon]